MTFIETLTHLIEKNGLTKSKLLKSLSINHNAINDWTKKNQIPNGETIKKIADYFNVSTDYLLGKTNIPNTVNNWVDQNAIPVGGVIKIPIYGTVSAGNGCLAEEDIIGYEIADEKYSTKDYFYLKVKGDSMYPRICDGDLVLVKKQSSLDSGSVGVFLVDDEDGVVKKVVYAKDFIELHSFNPLYPIRKFEGKDVLRVSVIGKVVKSETIW